MPQMMFAVFQVKKVWRARQGDWVCVQDGRNADMCPLRHHGFSPVRPRTPCCPNWHAGSDRFSCDLHFRVCLL